MKKILFITTAYILKNSSAAIRNNSLVKGLVNLGYEVDVCTVEWPSDLRSPFLRKRIMEIFILINCRILCG